MAKSDLIVTLESLTAKIEKLGAMHKQLQQRIGVLEDENQILRKELANERHELQKAKTDIEFLTVSHRLADNAESVITTRHLLGSLIRTIDNCIRMINEE